MLKLVIIAGLAAAAICGFMALRSSGVGAGLFGSGSNTRNILNDLKEIVGIPPISNTQISFKSSETSSGGGGGYLPPNEFRSDTENETAVFRITIASTKKPDAASSTIEIEESLSESEVVTTASTSGKPSSTTSKHIFHAELDVMNFSLSGQGETLNITNETSTPPPPKTPATTLQPPPIELELVDPNENSTGYSYPERSGLTIPPPLNKEYLPPKE